jgi:ATP-dependent NAD(P)H-hydrate dehydratase
VVGGSQEYTGAPYYAAASALRSGSDLAHIFCPLEALIPIKCYSPELIVHPNTTPIKEWLLVANTFVVGPGMGRSDDANKILCSLLEAFSLYDGNLNIVLDADALWFLQKEDSVLQLVQGLQKSGKH